VVELDDREDAAQRDLGQEDRGGENRDAGRQATQ
jgi:hypothetical protein